MPKPLLALALLALPALALAADETPARPMVVIDEVETVRDEPPPHGAIGMSTAYRISDGIPARTMEFRKRVLHPGAAIGAHVIAHDEVYYVLSGEGEVFSDGLTERLGPGMAAYLYTGATVGIRNLGADPLTIIISYPVERTAGE
jgi:mannose-6-phosphate isomerase-like protein (cupin superfamily)